MIVQKCVIILISLVHAVPFNIDNYVNDFAALKETGRVKDVNYQQSHDTDTAAISYPKTNRQMRLVYKLQNCK